MIEYNVCFADTGIPLGSGWPSCGARPADNRLIFQSKIRISSIMIIYIYMYIIIYYDIYIYI